MTTRPAVFSESKAAFILEQANRVASEGRRIRADKAAIAPPQGVREGFLEDALDVAVVEFDEAGDATVTESTATLNVYVKRSDGTYEPSGETLTVTNRDPEFSSARRTFISVDRVNGEWRPTNPKGLGGSGSGSDSFSASDTGGSDTGGTGGTGTGSDTGGTGGTGTGTGGTGDTGGTGGTGGTGSSGSSGSSGSGSTGSGGCEQVLCSISCVNGEIVATGVTFQELADLLRPYL